MNLGRVSVSAIRRFRAYLIGQARFQHRSMSNSSSSSEELTKMQRRISFPYSRQHSLLPSRHHESLCTTYLCMSYPAYAASRESCILRRNVLLPSSHYYGKRRAVVGILQSQLSSPATNTFNDHRNAVRTAPRILCHVNHRVQCAFSVVIQHPGYPDQTWTISVQFSSVKEFHRTIAALRGSRRYVYCQEAKVQTLRFKFGRQLTSSYANR